MRKSFPTSRSTLHLEANLRECSAEATCVAGDGQLVYVFRFFPERDRDAVGEHFESVVAAHGDEARATWKDHVAAVTKAAADLALERKKEAKR